MTRPARPWTDAERQELLDRLRASDTYADIARPWARSEQECREGAARLRAAGWGAIGARRRMGEPPPPTRRCCSCRQPFAPRTRFFFRCDGCRELHQAIAA